ncbi:wax ester/triacylglycerol synthase family O-acyltransferase [Mycobacterium sp. ACS4331]|uniref:wax ester/triacylglycerol synthase family O-acyltransferase n=1 Tax=Mycobacterium sp. ACS4331 TaxID=1834121 RepID=UPI0008009310|nr:wax ester/triacylglycerol synthase family O-acyltransferase [Mycobacterium sp. ACS4331]OBF12367.1 diacylglycerol O-acyltransferase [Mycobacterium sp. ACS4331]
MDDSFDATQLSDELSAVDQLLHRGEANPRTRSGIMALEVLDRAPEWERYRATFDNASRRLPRLRQKVVVPTLPTASARWVIDPDFNLDFHVRRVRVPEPGTLRQVFDMAEIIQQSPMDITRPLWSATLIEGLEDGRAAQILHLSHAVADGVGTVAMFGELYDLERDAAPRPRAPLPIPQDLSANDLMRQGINDLPGTIVGGILGAVSGAIGMAGKAIARPGSVVTGALNYASSSRRVTRQAAPPSPLLRRRSLSTRTEAIDIRLSDLHRAAKAAGGSINDAYLAGLCGALRRYHEALGVPIATLPMAVPVNLRSDSDPAGGNRFAGVNLAAPIGVADPAERIRRIRTQMTQRREEVALDVVGAVAPLFSLLPDAILESMTGSVIVSDVQASNIPVFSGDTFIAGAQVLRQYGIGPLPGVAMMVVLVSRSGWCTISTRYDQASITNGDLFARSLLAGFDEVLALAGDPAPVSAPASFFPAAESASPQSAQQNPSDNGTAAS